MKRGRIGFVVLLAWILQSGLVLGQQWQGSQDQNYAIYRNGNVGIGTTIPQKLLDLSAPNNGGVGPFPAIRLQVTGGGAYRWDLQGDNSYFKLYSADTPIITAHYSGNVGIGTTSPGAKLDVAGAVRVKNNDALGYGLYFLDSSNKGIGFLQATGNNLLTLSSDNYSDLTFGSWNNSSYQRNVTILRVNGNVGIGTTTPNTKLEINDNSTISGIKNILILNNNKTAVAGDGVKLEFRHNFDPQPTGRIFTEIYNPSDLSAKLHLGARYWNGTNYTNTNLTLAYGNVGIGTTSPGAKLDVDGNIVGRTYITAGSTGYNGAIYLARANDGSLSGQITHTENNTLTLKQTGGLGSNIKMGPSGIEFQTEESNSPYNKITRLIVQHGNNGYVGIGTMTPDYKLDVVGKIRAHEIIVNTVKQSDFVFEENYPLKKLEDVEEFVKDKKHLPDIPSEKEVAENGLSVGEMQTKLLQKIEELTLYAIEQQKEIQYLKSRVAVLEKTEEK